jgi:ABC-type bacteriocin/lantibiotic exporter with double-glycine peptidase domain
MWMILNYLMATSACLMVVVIIIISSFLPLSRRVLQAEAEYENLKHSVSAGMKILAEFFQSIGDRKRAEEQVALEQRTDSVTSQFDMSKDAKQEQKTEFTSPRSPTRSSLDCK